MGLSKEMRMDLLPIKKTVLCADGYLLQYRTWTPNGVPCATIILVNGIMSHSGWFQPLAESLLLAGFKLIGADRRGTGLNLEARGDAPDAKTLIDDLKCVIESEDTKGVPLHLVGWCWGAVLAINFAAEHESLLRSLVLLTPGLYPTDLVKANMRSQEQIRKSSLPTAPCLESPIAETMFTDGPFLESFIANDVQRTKYFTPRFYNVMVKMGMGASIRLMQIHLPLLLVLADADQATDNIQTMRAFEQIKQPFKLVTLYSAHGIQFDAPEHLSHILASWIIGSEHRGASPQEKHSC